MKLIMNKWVKRVLLLSAVSLLLVAGCSITHHKLLKGPNLTEVSADQSLTNDFKRVSGWNEAKLQSAFDYMDEAGTTSVIVFHKGQLVAEWGETDKVSSIHSVRKSIVSALYGIAVEKGLIDINKTLGELGIDDENPKLTNQEKQARLEDLLTARSGIYHPSIKNDNGPTPAPGSHPPNTHFFYNNWSFNAVGIIFEQLTSMKLGEAFEAWIAKPTGMQDFNVEDVRYYEGKESVFPAYRFYMSGRDLARFGLLYTQGGQWNGKQIIPAAWITRSLSRFSGSPKEVSYGYMWWIMPSGIYMATGTGGQKIWIDPANEIMIVNRVDTGDGFRRGLWWKWGVRVNNSNMRELNRLILAAKP